MVCWSKNIILQRGQVGSKIGNFQGYTIICVLLTQSCPTLCDPMDYSLPGFFVHGILQARILEWVVIPFSLQSIFLTQGSNLGLLHCRQILYHLSHHGTSLKLWNWLKTTIWVMNWVVFEAVIHYTCEICELTSYLGMYSLLGVH